MLRRNLLLPQTLHFKLLVLDPTQSVSLYSGKIFNLGMSKGEMLALARSTIGYRVKFC